MATTIKRISVSLTKEDLRQLEELKDHFGESINQVAKRSISFMHNKIKAEFYDQSKK
jgi:hypothetical protein